MGTIIARLAHLGQAGFADYVRKNTGLILHGKHEPAAPPRAVVLGATGVIGRATAPLLRARGIEVLGLGSREVDLAAPDAESQLEQRLRADDSLVMLAALTPDRGRDLGTMLLNLRMASAVCQALRRRPVRHVIYLSADAVYPMQEGAIDESTPPEPRDPYSAMHLAREDMFRRLAGAPVAILRATQVCSAEDTHHAYGPSRFFQQAARDGRIELFGGGEETRDHIMVDDVAAILYFCLVHASAGTLNVATGRSLSFLRVAEIVAQSRRPRPEIVFLPRRQAVTHRTFDVSALRVAFPGWKPTSLEDGIAQFASGRRTVAAT